MFESKLLTSLMRKTLILSFVLIPSACSTTQQSADSIREIEPADAQALEEGDPVKESEVLERSKRRYKKTTSYTVGMPTIGASQGPERSNAKHETLKGIGSGSLSRRGSGGGGLAIGSLGKKGGQRMVRYRGSVDIADAHSTAMNTEGYDHNPEESFTSVVSKPLSTFSIDVDTASYSNTRRFLNQGRMPPVDSVRIEEMVNYFSYQYPQPEGAAPFSVTTELTDCPWNKNNKLAMIGVQGEAVQAEDAPPMNLVFLIDVSGSMRHHNKLPLVKSGLKLLVRQMRPEDRIALVVYAGAAGVVLPSTSGANKQTIIAALDRLQSGGSTAGSAGIQLAYQVARQNFMENGNNRVILASDGDFNVGPSSQGELVRLIEKERNNDVFLSVLGFGMGNYKDNRMEQIANKGNGNYAYIDTILEAKKVLVTEMGGSLLTIAKDVKLQIEFNPQHVKSYRLIGYNNRRLANRDFNDDKKDAGELGSGHSVTAFYEIIPVGSDAGSSDTDKLRYQQVSPSDLANDSGEIFTVKLRYKTPRGKKSKLITKRANFETAYSPSENLLFASSVVEFGLLLRNSKFKGTASYTRLLTRAQESLGDDEYGYRDEFTKLVKMAELLK